MKNVLVIGILALGLVGCEKTEVVGDPANAPATEVAPGVKENDLANCTVEGGPTGSAPAQEPTVNCPPAAEVPVEPTYPTNEPKIG